MLSLNGASVLLFVTLLGGVVAFLFRFWALGKKSANTSGKRQLRQPDDLFLIKPYLQLGNKPALSGSESVEIHWYSPYKDEEWRLEHRIPGQAQWTEAAEPQRTKVKVEDVPKSHRFVTLVEGLNPGATFEYRIRYDGNVVFTATGMARKGKGQSYRYAIVGDLVQGDDPVAARKIAYQIAQTNPDVILLDGDIVYKRGRLSEYIDRFFPTYNSDVDDPTKGAGLMRSRLCLPVLGNHDVGMPDWSDFPDLDWHADLLAHFILWSVPLNGPLGKQNKTSVPVPHGKKHRKEDFYDAAGENFPRIANYSLDLGDTHWLVLDANIYMDWTDAKLRKWVDDDLAAAKDATWKFVCVHQPPFSSDVKHADEQRIRLLADIFEKHGVAAVFGGHYHVFERCYPLRFMVKAQPNGKRIALSGRVDGDFVLDKVYDGKQNTKPDGVMYITTGGGGATLYLNPGRRADHNNLPPFVFKLIDDIHSFTCCDVEPDKLTFRQISADGNEIDSFTITK